jgi:hypothetical protein
LSGVPSPPRALVLLPFLFVGVVLLGASAAAAVDRKGDSPLSSSASVGLALVVVAGGVVLLVRTIGAVRKQRKHPRSLRRHRKAVKRISTLEMASLMAPASLAPFVTREAALAVLGVGAALYLSGLALFLGLRETDDGAMEP